MRLLLAEDELAMAEAVADILTYHQYSVDTVSYTHLSSLAFLVGGVQAAIADILHHRAGKQVYILEHHTQATA